MAVLVALDIERATIVGHSSGGPSAVHFAAWYPHRTTALLLDSAILQPIVFHFSAIERATLESGFVIRLSYELVRLATALMTSFAVGGMSAGLTGERKRTAVQSAGTASRRCVDAPLLQGPGPQAALHQYDWTLSGARVRTSEPAST